MSKPIAGGHARIREHAHPKYAAMYPGLEADKAYPVVVVDPGYGGRKAVHLDVGTGRRVAVWSVDLRALPRCKYCNTEKHSSKACPEMKGAK